ncbi:MAG TPA: PASTA domain-containing protein, partial [Propionibacteriaceae bacterium]|nr:PASTA domain-containing protein [Propionibacteriaceae bacterium]
AIRRGTLKALPNVIGSSADTATKRLADAGFAGFVAGQVDSGYEAGTVAYTDPAGSALPGTRVALYLSTGQQPYVAPAPQPGTGQPGGPEPPNPDDKGPKDKRP